jgi:hypothetical protein
MGIILRPRRGNRHLDAEEIVKRLNAAGIESQIDGDWIAFNDSELSEPWAFRYREDELWVGEAYPTDDDPRSMLVMRIAKLIDYDTQGE